MKRRPLLVFVCLAATLAAVPAAADGIKITAVGPSTGVFPTSGMGVLISFDYSLTSTPDGQVIAQFTPAPSPGAGQTRLGASFSPVWVSKSGKAQISIVGFCSDTSVPSGTVNEVAVVLSKSAHQSGPIGPQLAKDVHPVTFSYVCPQKTPGRRPVPTSPIFKAPAPTPTLASPH
jgi:hypothetical protein